MAIEIVKRDNVQTNEYYECSIIEERKEIKNIIKES